MQVHTPGLQVQGHDDLERVFARECSAAMLNSPQSFHSTRTALVSCLGEACASASSLHDVCASASSPHDACSPLSKLTPSTPSHLHHSPDQPRLWIRVPPVLFL